MKPPPRYSFKHLEILMHYCISINYLQINKHYQIVSFSGDIKNPPGLDPVQPALGERALEGVSR